MFIRLTEVKIKLFKFELEGISGFDNTPIYNIP